MKSISVLFLALIVPVCANGQAGTAAAPAHLGAQKLTGVWRGQFDALPGVDMVISEEGGELHGAILFYLHRRQDLNSPYTSTPGLPEPIFDMKLDANALSFQVSHRRAHPPGTLHDPPMRFRLTLTGPDQAELVNESEGAPAVVMKRTDY